MHSWVPQTLPHKPHVTNKNTDDDHRSDPHHPRPANTLETSANSTCNACVTCPPTGSRYPVPPHGGLLNECDPCVRRQPAAVRSRPHNDPPAVKLINDGL